MEFEPVTHLSGKLEQQTQGESMSGDKKWHASVTFVLLCAFLSVVPTATLAQTGISGAMLAARGKVAVNGREVAASQALLPGDLTVTEKESGGNLTQNGTNAMLGPETALRYEGDYSVLERGGVSANTQNGFAVQVGCWTIKPQLWNQWTEFAVSYASAGEILIQARANDVRVYGRAQKARDKDKKDKTEAAVDEGDRARDVNGAPEGPSFANLIQDPKADRGEILRSGQEMRREACPAAAEEHHVRPRGGAASAASSGPLNSTGALYGGAAAAGVVTVLFLVKHDEPASPKNP